MPGDTVREGAIPADGVVALLRELELERTSGVLRFDTDGTWREVALAAGQLALDQALVGGEDPVEAFLAARSGRFEVVQRLPPLAVSKGDARVRTGSLAVHIPVDLMTYCERAGLTGLLEFARDGERAEAVYDKGELTAIRFGGRVGGDVNAVFAWETGTFKVEALRVVPELESPSESPSESPQPTEPEFEAPVAAASGSSARRDDTVPVTRKARRRRDDTGQLFLKVIETTLGAVVAEAERGRSPTRTSPPLAASPSPRADSVAPPRPSREATVRIIYLTGEALAQGPNPAERVSSTRHVRTDVTGEMMLADARPERMRAPPQAPLAAAPAVEEPLPSRSIGLALAGLVLALGMIGAVVAGLHHLR